MFLLFGMFVIPTKPNEMRRVECISNIIPIKTEKRFPFRETFFRINSSHNGNEVAISRRVSDISRPVGQFTQAKGLQITLYNATFPSLQTTSVAGTFLFQFSPFVIAFHSAIVPSKVMLVKLLQTSNAS